MKKTIFTLSALSIILMATSCKKGDTGLTGATGATGPALTGSLQGYAQLYDSYGDRIYTSQVDSVKVWCKSTTPSVNDSTVTTGTSGQYVFNNLQTGTYNLNYSYTGHLPYAPTQVQSLQFTGGSTQNRDVAISAIPNTFTVTSLIISDTTGIVSNPSVYYANIKGTVNTIDTKSRTVAIFLSTTAGVSNQNYIWNLTVTIPPNSTSFTYFARGNGATAIPSSQPNSFFLAGEGITSSSSNSTSIYGIAYPAASKYASTSSYENLLTGTTVYNAVSLSGAVTANGIFH
jgi:hypothetical protein